MPLTPIIKRSSRKRPNPTHNLNCLWTLTALSSYKDYSMAHLMRQKLPRQSGDVGTGVEWCRAGPLVGVRRPREPALRPSIDKSRDVGTGVEWCRAGPLVGVRGPREPALTATLTNRET